MHVRGGIISTMETIYIDSLFLINLAVNYLILLATGKLGGVTLKRLRLGFGAVIGGIYAVLTVLPQTAFMTSAAMKLVSAVFMLLAAFGREKHFLRISVMFFAVSAAFGGAVYAVSLLGGGTGGGTPYVPISARVLLLSFAASYLMITLVFRRVAKRAEREILSVEIVFNGKKAKLTALRDTGNTLSDPVSGSHVMVAEEAVFRELISLEAAEAISRTSDPVEQMVVLGRMPGNAGRFRLIPFSAVGVSSGVLLCFRPDELRIDGVNEVDVMVAISRDPLCGDGEYAAVI